MSSGQNFFTAVEQSRLTLTTPLLILSVLIRYNLEFRLGALNRAHEDIYSFEKGLGIRYDHPEEVHMGTLDFGHFTKGLNAVTADLAYMAWSGGNTQRQLGFLDGVAEKYKDLALVNGHKEDDAEEVRVLLLESHAHLRCWNMGLEARGEYLSKRAQALVQTVSTYHNRHPWPRSSKYVATQHRQPMPLRHQALRPSLAKLYTPSTRASN